jgi:hypothetical protein
VNVDPGLFEHCTPRQREVLEAYEAHGNGATAAVALGTDRTYPDKVLRDVRKKAARLGYAPGHFADGTAPGYLMGKVTVQRGPGGTVERTWERQSPEQALAQEAFEQAVTDLCSGIKGKAPLTAPPVATNDDLLTVIPMGDPHFGLLAWAREVGENFDLEIAERVTFAAVDRLCSLTPATGTAMLLNLGDYFHADNGSNRTPRGGNELDVDGRFAKIASVGFRAMIRCVDRLLEKHGKVIVRNNRGNHDPHQAAMLTIALDAYYHAEPRVEVEPTPSGFYFYRFGKVLIGSTHGDGAKLADLPLIMANDAPHDWAAATFRVWHCGHFHHDQVKDLVGCTVETHRTLAAGDAWHRYAGYRANRDMKAIVYHREFGEVNRIRCGVEMLEAA